MQNRYQKCLLWIVCVLFSFAFLYGTQPEVLAQTDTLPNRPTLMPPDPIILADMFVRINALRARRGLPSYEIHPSLNQAAQDQAEWLVISRTRSHFRPDGSRPSTRAFAAGFTTTHWCCGENYYMSIDATPDMVFNFWTWSPNHLVNLIHPDFTHIGLGMTSDGYRISYVTVFGQQDVPPS